MFTRAAWEAFTERLDVAAGGLSGPEVSALLARTARAERDAVVSAARTRTGGVAPAVQTSVDGSPGASEETVRPDGVILIEYRYLAEIAGGVLADLKARAPVRTGAYRDAFAVFVDGREADLSAIGFGTREVAVVNTQPYARRIEIGRKRGGGPFVVQVPDRFVERTALAAAGALRGIARVRFTYREVGTVRPSAMLRATRRQARRMRAELRQPAIVFTAA